MFLQQYNWVKFYDNQRIDEVIYLDVCLTGSGGAFNNMVYVLDHLEMINIMVAIKIWGTLWANKKYEFIVTTSLWLSY